MVISITMLEIDLYKYGIEQKQKYRGVPLRETALRRVWDTPNGRDPSMPDPIQKENPFSAMADRSRAISVQRKINEMVKTLTDNGVSADAAKQQADLLLNGLSKDVLDTIKERADLKTSEEKKSAAVDQIVTNITAINTRMAAMTPEEIARNITAQEASRSVLSGGIEDYLSSATTRPGADGPGFTDFGRALLKSEKLSMKDLSPGEKKYVLGLKGDDGNPIVKLLTDGLTAVGNGSGTTSKERDRNFDMMLQALNEYRMAHH